MYTLNLILLWYLCSFSTVESNFANRNIAYKEFVKEVINFEALQEKIKNELWDTDEGKAVSFLMFDASTKIPTGIGAGNLFDLGNFDECYAIKYEDKYGKYCLGTLQLTNLTQKYIEALGLNATQPRPTFQIHPQPRLAGLGTEYTGYHFAACVLSNWSASDIPGLLTYSEDFCYSKATEPELSTGAIVTIVVLSIFLALIVASTVFDLVLHYREKKTPHDIFLAFSFLSNGRKIFRASTNPDQLLCLNGIKAISMMWVVIGHEFLNAMNGPITNFPDILKWENNAANMYIMGATVSVDTFFVVGGLVTVYTFLKSMDKGVKFNVILYYIHRYLRLTPAFVVMSLIHLYLLNYLGNGPLWKSVDLILVKTCETGWWSSFLYITNYIEKGNCLPETWYLSVDMQLFVLSPIILIPIHRWPKIGLGALGALTVAGCIVPFAIGYAEHLGTLTNGDSMKYVEDYYSQMHTRFGPYVIGMILGYYIYKIRKGDLVLRIKPWLVLLLWLVSLTGLAACVYAGHPLNIAKDIDRWANSLFLAFDRNGWAVSLCGVILLCVTGYGGPIDKFLSLPIFQFLTKVSYAMYLVHYSVITIRYAAMKNLMKFSNISLLHAFWGDFIFTLIFSVILCLAFESPIIIIEKYLFGGGSRKHKEKKPEV